MTLNFLQFVPSYFLHLSSSDSGLTGPQVTVQQEDKRHIYLNSVFRLLYE